jgi:hypothetical protein
MSKIYSSLSFGSLPSINQFVLYDFISGTYTASTLTAIFVCKIPEHGLPVFRIEFIALQNIYFDFSKVKQQLLNQFEFVEYQLVVHLHTTIVLLYWLKSRASGKGINITARHHD